MNSATKNWALGALAILLFGFAGYRMFAGGGKKFQAPQTVVSYGVCLACKQDAEIIHPLNEAQPYKCPSCDEQAVYEWLYCNECHRRFVPDLAKDENGVPRPVPFASCRHCQCTNVAGYHPKHPMQSPVGDAPLPKWP